MKNLLFQFLLISLIGCAHFQSNENPEVEKIVIDSSDATYGYYHSVQPKGEINSVLVLLPGFGQKSEDIFLDTKFLPLI